jgi:metal-dependent amidase/aminoacylase/carboxypeptidase family protein
MDALAVVEETGVPYASTNGFMHACGHDLHMAMGVGAARILASRKSELKGEVIILFQPGEEVLPGGSSLMIKEGVLHNPKVDIAIAQHVFPSMEVGKVGFKSGMYMASTDEIHITITGKGGHAAMVGEYKNPLVVAASIIKEIENQFPFVVDEEGVARNLYNNIPTVIAFGKIEGKGATNIIPESVYLAGTFRTMDEVWRKTSNEEIATIYLRNGNHEILHRSDLVSGAILESIIDRAKEIAIRRSLENREVPTGLKSQDITDAVQQEFAENDILPKSDQVEDWVQLLDVKAENCVAVKTRRTDEAKSRDKSFGTRRNKGIV